MLPTFQANRKTYDASHAAPTATAVTVAGFQPADAKRIVWYLCLI
jgi:hypothetical protein